MRSLVALLAVLLSNVPAQASLITYQVDLVTTFTQAIRSIDTPDGPALSIQPAGSNPHSQFLVSVDSTWLNRVTPASELTLMVPDLQSSIFWGFRSGNEAFFTETGVGSDLRAIIANASEPILDDYRFDVLPVLYKGGKFPQDSILPFPDPGLPAEAPGFFLHEQADLGFRSIWFGTYSITRLPAPSSIITICTSILALAAVTLSRRRRA